jgi:hypothetical protein
MIQNSIHMTALSIIINYNVSDTYINILMQLFSHRYIFGIPLENLKQEDFFYHYLEELIAVL